MYRYAPAKARNALRIFIGRFVFRILRGIYWIKNSSSIASQKDRKSKIDLLPFKFTAASHNTPLFRQLSDMDVEYQKNKVHNLTLALNRITGLVLEPGKTFSYWRLIGYPGKIRGFKKGITIVNGHTVPHTGGGLCQLSNLIFWMTLHTPLTVTERYRHSFDVFPDQNRTQPFGSGATCFYNYRDLQIKNNTDRTFVLELSIHDGRLWGEWKTKTPVEGRYEVYEDKHWITQEGPNVYVRHNILRKRHFVPGSNGNEKLEDDSFVAENHALMMYSPLLSAPQTFSKQN